MIPKTMEFSVSLIIYTNDSIENISEYLCVSPTDYFFKGERKSKLRFLKKAKTNVWKFEKKYKKQKKCDGVFQKFFDEIGLVPEKIEYLNSIGMCKLRLYIQSDNAQVFHSISPSDMQYLANMKLPLDISVFSWGKI